MTAHNTNVSRIDASASDQAAHLQPGMAEIDAAQAIRWFESGSVLLVDVREAGEFADEHIPGAVLLPLSTLAAGVVPAPTHKPILIHCLSGKRSAEALRHLPSSGPGMVAHLRGGLLAWKAAGGRTRSFEL